MAYEEITNDEIQVGKPLRQELFQKIKGNFDALAGGGGGGGGGASEFFSANVEMDVCGNVLSITEDYNPESAVVVHGKKIVPNQTGNLLFSLTEKGTEQCYTSEAFTQQVNEGFQSFGITIRGQQRNCSANGQVKAIVFDGDSTLYVGGSFSQLMGVPCSNIGQINLNTMVASPLTTGCNGAVEALCWDAMETSTLVGQLFVGGTFTNAGGVTVSNIAKFSNGVWSAMGAGVDAAIYCFDFDSKLQRLYIGGIFANAGGVAATRICYNDTNATYTALGAGCNGMVRSIKVDLNNDRVWVVGDFTTANSVTVNYFTYWNGSTFVAMGGGTNNSVRCISLDIARNCVYIAGQFTVAGGASHTRFVKYAISSSTYVSAALIPATVTKMDYDSVTDRLLLGGDFIGTVGTIRCDRALIVNPSDMSLTAGPFMPTSVTAICAEVDAWGTNGKAAAQSTNAVNFGGILNESSGFLEGIQANGHINCFCRGAGDLVYLGGAFNTVNGVAASRVASYNVKTGEVKALSYGVNNTVNALGYDTFANKLYIGGEFTYINDIWLSVNQITLWNPATESYSALGSGLNGPVRAFAFDPFLNRMYIGGNFNTGNGVTVNRLTYWNGTTFVAFGAGANGDVRALYYANTGLLYIGGDFTTLAGNSIARIASSNGTTFSAVGSGMNSSVYAITGMAFDTSIFIGGQFTTSSGITTNRLAKWDGVTFSAFGEGFPSGTTVNALAVNASDEYLYVGGNFSRAVGLPTGKIARITLWNNRTKVYNRGFNNTVKAFFFSDLSFKLFIGGEFTRGDKEYIGENPQNLYIGKKRNMRLTITQGASE
jgi:hypothetical protein